MAVPGDRPRGHGPDLLGINRIVVTDGRSELTTMAVAPSDHLTIYAGTTWAGVARSTDGGGTWTTSGTGP